MEKENIVRRWVGLQVDIDPEWCGKCFKGKDKSGMIRLCNLHCNELENVMLLSAFNWANKE